MKILLFIISSAFCASFCYIQHKQDWIILQESCFENWNGINVTEEQNAIIDCSDISSDSEMNLSVDLFSEKKVTADGFIIGQVKSGPYPKDTESPCDLHSANAASGFSGEYVIFCEENSKKQNCGKLQNEECFKYKT
jgi:hypothetical protein